MPVKNSRMVTFSAKKISNPERCSAGSVSSAPRAPSESAHPQPHGHILFALTQANELSFFDRASTFTDLDGSSFDIIEVATSLLVSSQLKFVKKFIDSVPKT